MRGGAGIPAMARAQQANKRHYKHLHNLGELAMRSYWEKISRSIGLTVNYLAGGERNRAGYSASIQGTRA